MKKIMIILIILKMCEETKRKYPNGDNKNLNAIEKDHTNVLLKKSVNCDTCENFNCSTSSSIKHPHTKLRELLCQKKYYLPNKDNELAVLSNEDVEICLNEVENTINSEVSVHVMTINSQKEEANKKTLEDFLPLAKKSLLNDRTENLPFFKEDDENIIRNQTDNGSITPALKQKNIKDGIKAPAVSYNAEIKELDLIKAFFEEKLTKEDPICYSSIKNHPRRLKDIEEAYFLFEKDKQNDKNNETCIWKSFDRKLIENLLNFFLEFDKSLTFNRDSCLIFLTRFDYKIFYSPHSSEIREILARLPIKQRKIVFYSELMKLYKYAVDIPELLTLGNLYFHESSRKVIFVMHLTKLFAENVKNIKENRTFLMFLIYKVFNSFYGRNFDMFCVPYYDLELCNLKHDLTFFTWELTSRKRANIKRRNIDGKFIYSDNKCLKNVLLLLLCQHTIFIKYYNINAENVALFQEFIKKVIQAENCVGCLFNEYLNILKLSINRI